MFIVWGTKRVEKKLGWVADYCHVCDEARVHRLIEARMVSHVYFIPLGRGKSASHFRQCKHCKNQFATDPQRFVNVSKKKLSSLEELTDVTNPELIEHMANLVDLRERAALGEVNEDDRRALLFQGFYFAASPVAKRKETINFNWISSLWLIAMVVIPIVVFLICESISVSWMNGDLSIWLSVGAFLFFLVGAVIRALGDTSRYIRRRFAKIIVDRIAPFNPSVEELQDILLNLKEDPDTKAIAKAFDAGTLHKQITIARENKALDI